MTTLNISLPESMRRFIEEQAAEGEFTTSEYIRHLIRMDQEEKKREKRLQVAQYLALCEQQLANGQYREWDGKTFLKEMKTRYKKSKSK